MPLENVPVFFHTQKFGTTRNYSECFLSILRFFAPLSFWFHLFLFLPALIFLAGSEKEFFFFKSTWLLWFFLASFRESPPRTAPLSVFTPFGIYQQITLWLKTSSASHPQQKIINKPNWTLLLLANIWFLSFLWQIPHFFPPFGFYVYFLWYKIFIFIINEYLLRSHHWSLTKNQPGDLLYRIQVKTPNLETD